MSGVLVRTSSQRGTDRWGKPSCALFSYVPGRGQALDPYYQRTVESLVCDKRLRSFKVLQQGGAFDRDIVQCFYITTRNFWTSRDYARPVVEICRQAGRNGGARAARERGQPREEETLGTAAAEGGGGDADEARGSKPR